MAYARDMEHADELKTKIEVLVYSVEAMRTWRLCS